MANKGIVFSKSELQKIASDRRLSAEQKRAIANLLAGIGNQDDARVAGHALKLFAGYVAPRFVNH